MDDRSPMMQFRPDGVLGKRTPAQLNQLIGEVVGLMMLSPVHRVYQVRDVADIIVFLNYS